MKKIRSCERGVRTLVSVTAVLIGILSVSSNTAAAPFVIRDCFDTDLKIPSVGSNGADFVVTSESDAGGDWYFRGYHVVPAGGGEATVFDPNFVEPAGQLRYHAVTAGIPGGGNFLTVWNHLSHFYAQRSIASEATPDVIAFSTTIDHVNCDSDLAFGVSSYLLVYQRGLHIYGDRVDPTRDPFNVPEGEKLIATCPDAGGTADLYEEPAVAFDGTNYLVVWTYNYGDGYGERIYGQRVEQDGDKTGGVIDISGAWASSSYPDVAFGSAETYYLVVWIEVKGSHLNVVYGRKVDTDGSFIGDKFLIEPDGGCAGSTPISVSVAYGGGKFRICWQQNDDEPGHPIYYREMNAASPYAMSPKCKCNSTNTSGSVPDIAYASIAKADTFLVVWAEAGKIMGNFNCNEPLYVELLGFDASSRQGYVLLDWRTEVEVDNSHWVIKKRTEGESEWKELVRVPAKPAGPNTYTHRDSDVRPGATYWYQLGDIDTNGKLTWHPEVKVKYTGKASPSQLQLAVAPTVSMGIFRLKYQIPGSASAEQQMPVSLKVYDAGGRLAHTLFEGTKSAGSYSTTWHPEEAPGIYFCELRVGGKRAVKKLIWCEDSRHCGCD